MTEKSRQISRALQPLLYAGVLARPDFSRGKWKQAVERAACELRAQIEQDIREQVITESVGARPD